MKHRWGIALIVAGCLWAAPWVCAQGQTEQQAQDQQDKNQQQGAKPSSQEKGNPFPTNTTNVPVMPSKVTPDVPEAPADESEGAKFSLPSSDADPMASPDDAGGESSSSQPQVSSSNVKGLESILPPPDEEPAGKQGRNGSNAQSGPPKEDPKQDINVGNYYLDNKDWKAALSRFQSALVLAPEDPEVYWGLAESQRHLGDYASAKANYTNVIVYDPDSKRAKEAKKALKDPEIANAKAAPEGQKPQ